MFTSFRPYNIPAIGWWSAFFTISPRTASSNRQSSQVATPKIYCTYFLKSVYLIACIFFLGCRVSTVGAAQYSDFSNIRLQYNPLLT